VEGLVPGPSGVTIGWLLRLVTGGGTGGSSRVLNQKGGALT